MNAASITELRLTAFKSHRGQTLTLLPLTLLAGPNASGKSNVIDALTLLALLADERQVGDLERGDEAVAGLRGGLRGAAPFNDPEVAVGCTVTVGDDQIDLDLRFDAGPRPEIIAEKLTLRRANGRKPVVLLETLRPERSSGSVEATIYSGGAPEVIRLAASRLAITQVAGRIRQDSKTREVVQACNQATSALRGIFILDPVASQMREYVKIGSGPDRSGRNTSALVYDLRNDDAAWSRLVELVRGLVETKFMELTFTLGGLEVVSPQASSTTTHSGPPIDVMLALREQAPAGEYLAQARVMSDGTLRYLAIVSTLLRLAREKPDELTPARRSLVIEEIENGLFPTQASRILDLLRAEATSRNITLLATTHSPALLDALRAEDHAGVFLCERDDQGRTTVQRLVDHERYVAIAGGGTVGSQIAQGRLRAAPGGQSFTELFAS